MNNPFPNWFVQTAESNFEDFCPKEGRALQIGTFTGDATHWLINNTNMTVVDVDTWSGSDEDAHDTMDFSDVERVYDYRFSKNKRVQKYKGTSDQFFREYDGEPFDFVYIDGDHTARQTLIDALNAWELLNLDGIMAFDDLGWDGGKGETNNPRIGIEAFIHIVKTKMELVAENSQAWIRKKQ